MSFTLRPDGDYVVSDVTIHGAASASAALLDPPAAHDGDASFVENVGDALLALELSAPPNNLGSVLTLRLRTVLRSVPEGALEYPTVLATATTTGSTVTSPPHTVNLPAGIQAGERLLVFYTSADTLVTQSRTAPSGWTTQYSAARGNMQARCYRRLADGSEGGTITIPGSGASRWTAIAVRVGTHEGTPVSGTALAGHGVHPTPPLVKPACAESSHCMGVRALSRLLR